MMPTSWLCREDLSTIILQDKFWMNSSIQISKGGDTKGVSIKYHYNNLYQFLVKLSYCMALENILTIIHILKKSPDFALLIEKNLSIILKKTCYNSYSKLYLWQSPYIIIYFLFNFLLEQFKMIMRNCKMHISLSI